MNSTPTSASPIPGSTVPSDQLADIAKLVTAYYTHEPDYTLPEQRIAFGTSGHRGSSFNHTFNENHVLVMTQAICDYKNAHGLNGPLFLGIDTHALSMPAYTTALEVLAGNGVDVMLAHGDEYTPTPAVSFAIIAHNRGRTSGLADGIIITPLITLPPAAASNTTPPTEDQRMPRSPDGSKSAPTRI